MSHPLSLPTISSEPSLLLESISPRGMQTTLRLSTAENTRRFMHADRYKEPKLAGLKRLGTAGSLSHLTARANQRLEGCKGDDTLTMTHSFGYLPLSKSSPRLPNESDYRRILERLNRIYTQGGSDTIKVAFTEGKTYEFLLEAGNWMYGKANVLGQFCPLVVNISRNRGRLVTYTSKTLQEPSDSLYDSRFFSDRIWVSDPGLRFTSSTIFIAFHALEESAFTISLQYGQKRKLNSRDKWKEGKETVFNQEEWVKLFKEMTGNIKKKQEIDFVKRNKKVEKQEERPRTEKSLHRQETMKKWRERLETKRQTALSKLNRAQLREAQRLLEAEQAKERQALLCAQEKFLTLLWGVKLAEQLKGAFHRKRTEWLLEKMKMFAVMKIQMAFRRHKHNGEKSDIAMRIAGKGLLALGRHVGAIQRESIRRKVFVSVQRSATNARLPLLFQSFYRHGNFHSVLCIQAHWRLSHLRRKHHFDRLVSAYNSALAQLLLPVTKKKSTSKSRKNKENAANRYLSIPQSVKNQVLNDYFRQARNKLKAEIRMKNTPKPAFFLSIRQEDLLLLIEKAADLALNSSK